MTRRLHPLTNPYFILSLLVLLTNDFFLKYEYHNWLTGKLSDFAGLFVFAYFWTTIFSGNKRAVCVITGIAFVYWKSTFSQPFIDVFSENIYPISRTVDLSDLLALVVLPMACFVSQKGWLKFKMAPIPIAALTIFSFCATSVPTPTQKFDRPEYVLFRLGDFQWFYPNEFQTYHRDSMTVVAVTRIETERFPALSDDYHKSLILADLDLRILRASKGGPNNADLSDYRFLRDSLTIPGPTFIALDLDSVSEELNFLGTRLNGPYRRYSREKQLLIDGRYKNGIPDSVWSFHDKEMRAITRQHFRNGEITIVEKVQNGKIATDERKTRRDSITKQYWILSVLSCLSILLIIRLFVSYRSSKNNRFVRMSTFGKTARVILLPTLVFVFAKVISGFISDSHSDLFRSFGQLMLTNAVLMPVLAVVLYGIGLKRRFDLILYILLFTFVLILIEEYYFLKSILV